MAYRAEVVADSVSPQGKRVTTLEVEMPRLILAEFNTPRMFSRNSASSRAIPVHKQIEKLLNEPFIPERFGINQKGMQSYAWLDGLARDEALRIWLRGRDRAVTTALELILGEERASDMFKYKPADEFATVDQLHAGFKAAKDLIISELGKEDPADVEILNVHKQLANRGLEPYMWQTVIVTATEWSNFMALRIDDEAQAEIRKPAELMLEAMEGSSPVELGYGEWHTPYIRPDEKLDIDTRVSVSTARCARVSYLTQDGRRDIAEDTTMYQRLVVKGHMSPTEHPCRPLEVGEQQKGNLLGWHQHRADLPNEDDFGKIKAARAGRE